MKKLLFSALLFLMAGALSADNLTSVWGTNGTQTVPPTKHLGRVFLGLYTNSYNGATYQFYGQSNGAYGWFPVPSGGAGGTPGGADSNIQINQGGSFYGTNSLCYVAFSTTGVVLTNKMGGTFAVMAPGVAIGSTNTVQSGVDVQFRMGANGVMRWDDAGTTVAGVIDTLGNTSGRITQKWYRRTDTFGIEHVYFGDTDSKYYIANRQGDLLIGSKSNNVVAVGYGYSGGFTTVVSVDPHGLNGHGNSISNFVGLGGGSGMTKIAVIEDQKANNTPGGSGSTGSWLARDLNTIVENEGSHITALGTNTFQLDAGTYFLRAFAPFNSANGRMRFYNVTAGAPIDPVGPSIYVYSGTCLTTNITISTPTEFRLEYYLKTGGGGTETLGVEQGMGDPEHYAQVEIWRK